MKQIIVPLITFVIGCMIGVAIYTNLGERLGAVVIGAAISFAVLMWLTWR